MTGHILLIVEAETASRPIFEALGETDHRVTLASPPAGLAAVLRGVFDLVVIDLSERDGLAIVQALRAAGDAVPVLFASARDDAEERARSLRAGGDDYLVSPFVPIELDARIEALLRRPFERRVTKLAVGPLELDLIERRARRHDRDIPLLPREFKLLEYLMRHKSQVVGRETLLREVWNYPLSSHPNLVDVHIGKLRRKIDAAGEMPLIQSVRGVGYALRAPD